MLIYLLRHGLTAYNAEKRYQGQRDIPPCAPRAAPSCGRLTSGRKRSISPRSAAPGRPRRCSSRVQGSWR